MSSRPIPWKGGVDCPRCHKDLVVRDGKHGEFIGCTGYPTCKFTCSIVDMGKHLDPSEEDIWIGRQWDQ